MPNYDKENCEGCLHFDTTDQETGSYCWYHKSPFTADIPVNPGHRCLEFAPSLMCRQVRALEKLAGCVEGEYHHASDGVTYAPALRTVSGQ